jgi:hypothetical protein
MPTPPDLAGILQRWPKFGGYNSSFDKIALTDLLAVDLEVEWGSLVNRCQASGFEDIHQLMFLFGLISFRNNVNLDIIHTLIAFSILDDLKTFRPPMWPCFTHFRHNRVPIRDNLFRLIEICLVPYDCKVASKQRKKLVAAQRDLTKDKKRKRNLL